MQTGIRCSEIMEGVRISKTPMTSMENRAVWPRRKSPLSPFVEGGEAARGGLAPKSKPNDVPTWLVHRAQA
ncbi:MAG: hypothetical protein C4520_00800 [Candidatus Abyssobacteria bacterium SURF_5]|uniref:Uncharacterized protein n=1 Tax=Abyssobacteria bacterium (strain SURF_5) TaxID=2093360 RepID=A0A3A4P0P7_ABYX5|nr:MAG: hypothetical protein C4520_00800 [Candidatus Abyssubacteria bacterium SURF_5]